MLYFEGPSQNDITFLYCKKEINSLSRTMYKNVQNTLFIVIINLK